MIEDHIMDGTMSFASKPRSPMPGYRRALIAAKKRRQALLSRRRGKIRLQPANSEMAPIMVAANDLKIQAGHRSTPQVLALDHLTVRPGRP